MSHEDRFAIVIGPNQRTAEDWVRDHRAELPRCTRVLNPSSRMEGYRPDEWHLIDIHMWPLTMGLTQHNVPYYFSPALQVIDRCVALTPRHITPIVTKHNTRST